MLGCGQKNGYAGLKKKFGGEARFNYYELSDLKMVYPWIDNWDDRNKKKTKYEERKSRIFMRGIKIGVKRTGNVNKNMSMFEQKDKPKTAEQL